MTPTPLLPAEHDDSVELKNIHETDIPKAVDLLAQFPNFIRPTVIGDSLSRVTLEIMGAFHDEKGLVGCAILQDFGIRKLISDVIVDPDFTSRSVEAALVNALIKREERKGPGRVLSIASNVEREELLRSIGFEIQPGEYYLRRQLSGIKLAPARPLVGELRLESYSPQLVADSVSLWSTEADMHLPPWEDFALINSTVLSRGVLYGLRETRSNQLVATVLASTEGVDAMLFHLYVAPNQRRVGLGRVLVEKTLENLVRSGCASALVCVHDERARTFWESVGFMANMSDCLLQLDVSPISK